MSPEKLLLMFLILTTLYGTSISTFYKVGGSAGWISRGNFSYHNWTSSKTFVIGDTLLFKYDNRSHNVLQVDLQDYHSCNASAPMAKYTSGNDLFTIGNHGHFFFICGMPGQCLSGLKVDVRVPRDPNQTINGTMEAVVPNRVKTTVAAPSH